MSKTQTAKNQINKDFSKLGTYHPEIPLFHIFEIVRAYAGEVVQEDGTPWSGFLCGENGNCTFDIANVKFHLFLSWYTMPSGNYEITVYVS
jgi:hypothetical protein